jgi:predicted glycoside hydrolase/deacetylase ChbG (UPF0249 family)
MESSDTKFSARPVDVIVNADDLGISSEVNDAVFDFMARGLVTSATLIANAPRIEAATKRIGQFPSCSFGVHLNVTEFEPLTGPHGLKPLLDERGAFQRDPIRQVSIDSSLAEGILAEFCAQTEKLLSLGVEISHIDSHQHVHTIPRLFPILKKLQKKYGLRRVRISRNIYGSYESCSTPMRLKKMIFNFLLRNYRRTQTTQAFTDLKAFCDIGKSGRPSYRSVELMVHPGLRDYDDGTDLLPGLWRQSLSFPVRLINYNDLD